MKYHIAQYILRNLCLYYLSIYYSQKRIKKRKEHRNRDGECTKPLGVLGGTQQSRQRKNTSDCAENHTQQTNKLKCQYAQIIKQIMCNSEIIAI